MEVNAKRTGVVSVDALGLLDTGCSNPLIASETVNKMRNLVVRPATGTTLTTASGEPMSVIGEADVFVNLTGGSPRPVTMVVTDSLPDNDQLLLSISALEHLCLLPVNWPFNQTWGTEGPVFVENRQEEEEGTSNQTVFKVEKKDITASMWDNIGSEIHILSPFRRNDLSTLSLTFPRVI